MHNSTFSRIGHDGVDDLNGWTRALLASLSLIFTMPAMADNRPNTPATVSPPKVAAGHNNTGHIDQNSFSFGVSRSRNPPTGSGGKEVGQPNVGEIHKNQSIPTRTNVTSVLKNPTTPTPCAGPNPPRSCKQPKPKH